MGEKVQSSPAKLASLPATAAASVTKAGFQEHFYPYRQDFWLVRWMKSEQKQASPELLKYISYQERLLYVLKIGIV